MTFDPRVFRALSTLAVAGIAALAGREYVTNKERTAFLQRAFERFHERIRHEQFGERDLLRERREALQARLKEVLNPEFRPRLFQQGSYALQTGVKPLSGSGFDMDLGLVLGCRRSTFTSCIEAKQAVRDALRQGARQVRIRRSCVTVEYKDKTFGDYHVDLAVYVQEPDDKMYLAKGKEHSEERLVFWQQACPEELTRLLNSKFTSDDMAQFRRCIRYLKRWKQVNFTTKAPYSIAITVAAYHWFEPATHGFFQTTPDDAKALLQLTERMLAAAEDGRLRVPLPVQPQLDLMERLTAPQMRGLLEKLGELHTALAAGREHADPEVAVQELRQVFGTGFSSD